jgi:peptide deformylase
MAVLPLIIAPDPILKQKSAPVAEVNDEIRKILADMLDTMYQAAGIGLAAVQVGILKRLIVIDTSWREEDAGSRKPLKLINAEIVWDSQQDQPYREGCLSFPDHYSEVARPHEVKIRYLDEDGKSQELHAEGLLATCIQHEIDHTNGIVFVDHISRTKKEIIVNKLKKAKKLGLFDPHHHHDHVHGEHCNHG